jgi:hypothetical protein
MITTKHIVGILVTMSVLAGFVLAQTDSSTSSLVGKLQQPELRRELALTPQQDAKLAKITEREKNDLRLIGQKRMISQAKREALVRAALEKSTKQARAVLSSEQLAKLGSK